MPARDRSPRTSTFERRPILAVLVLGALVLAVLLAGCGDNASAPASATASSASAASATAASPTAAASSSELAAPGTSPTAAGPATPPASAAVAAAPYPLPSVTVSLQKVVSGLTAPVTAVAPGTVPPGNAGGDGRIFVVGQQGQIVIVANGTVASTFLDISDRISCCGERGLLGLAFHPDYATNGRFFVRYTDKTGDVVVAEFHRSADPNKADAGSGRVLLTIAHREFPNHNGGTIAFGPDGKLYVGTGDGGGAGDPHGHGQDAGSLLGKLLRIDVNAVDGSPYGIPTDNPFRGRSGARPEVWSYGLRNPYGFSFDRATGDLWIADVGQNAWEEIDRARAADGTARGANFGWNVLEASHCFNPSSGCDPSGKTPPLAQYDHSAGNCAVLGGFVYRGAARPDLAGRYFFADYCSGRIWDLSASGPETQTLQLVLDTGLRLTGWGQGADGELYVTSTDGGLYRLA